MPPESAATTTVGLSAEQRLRPPKQSKVTWGAFDPDWYLGTYPGVRGQLAATDFATVLRYYLAQGRRQGHSPNIMFDEAWYRRCYPANAALVDAGAAPSGFDLYSQQFLREHVPHWLFDEHLYRTRYTDLTDAVLDAAGFANGYDHYLRHGSSEGRLGHRFFEPSLYCAELDVEEAQQAEAIGPHLHYLRRIAAGKPELPTTCGFDPEWYLRSYPQVALAIARGDWLCALHHYLCNDTPTAFDPLPLFSEQYYLMRYPDVASAVAAGLCRSGYWHFLNDGARERRSPNPAVDLEYYVVQPEVAQDLEQGRAPDGFVHYLTIGRARGLALAPVDKAVTEAQAKALFRQRANSLLPLFAHAPLDFTCAGAPAVTVIMVLHDRFALTLQALGSLRTTFSEPIELVLVDSGSTDATQQIERFVHGAKLLRLDSNIGFVHGCNTGLHWATGPAVLFLNNDVELAPGAVTAALRRLTADPTIGAVGGKVIRTHGKLQEAGTIIWRDGITLGYLRDASPQAPEANFVRDVDACSGVFLLVRGALLGQLGGFQTDYAPAYYEDTDLCVRIRQAGYRVVYDPAVVIRHLEYGSADGEGASAALIARNRQVFARIHADYLTTREAASPATQMFARFATLPARRLLFIEDTVPLRQLGSGFVRSNDVLQALAALGWQVTLFPVNGSQFDLASVYHDMPETVEVMHDRTLDDLPAFLHGRRGYFDTVWIARTHNLRRVRAALQATLPDAGRPPYCVLDTEAINALRDAGRAALQGKAFDLDAALAEELADQALCQCLVAVNPAEAAVLRAHGCRHVQVAGHVRLAQPTPNDFADRAGLLFVGAIHRSDSPNLDSLAWFTDAVLPLIEQALGWETRLTVVGYVGDDVALDRFRDHPRITLRGAMVDTMPLYDTHRVFVAPTRFAAGTPYKVHEAASLGLPVVATELLRQQLGWQNARDLLAVDHADPAGFADAIIRLYRDAALWGALRDGALARIRAENGRQTFEQAIRAALPASD